MIDQVHFAILTPLQRNWCNTGPRPRLKQSPLAARAASTRALLEGQEDQSILISGVSGAGKTETAKLLLGHLATVAGSEEGGPGSERIQHMVECTVVLESFGNAVMVRRFTSRDSVADPRVNGFELEAKELLPSLATVGLEYCLTWKILLLKLTTGRFNWISPSRTIISFHLRERFDERWAVHVLPLP